MDKAKAKFEEIVELISAKTGQKAEHVQWGLGGLVVMILFCGIGGSLVTKMVGFAYPAFESLKATESVDGADDKKWLTYWVVYGLFVMVENLVGPLFGLIPFYFFAKLLFLVYLFHPITNGAQTVYEKVVQPLFKEYEDEIDAKFQEAKDFVT